MTGGSSYCKCVAPAIASHPDHLRASQPPRSVSADWSSANPERPIKWPQLRPLHRPVTTPPPSFSHTVISATGCVCNQTSSTTTTTKSTQGHTWSYFRNGAQRRQEQQCRMEAPWTAGRPCWPASNKESAMPRDHFPTFGLFDFFLLRWTSLPLEQCRLRFGYAVARLSFSSAILLL